MDIQGLTEKYIMKTYNRYNLAFEKGDGMWLYTFERKKYLDMASGIAVNSLGYNHPRLTEAIKTQAEKLLHTSNLYYTEPGALVAAELVEKSGFDKVFFCNSGAEANEGAIKMARKFGQQSGSKEKFQIITLKNSFHGRTLAAITATGQEKYQKSFTPVVEGFTYVEMNNMDEMEKAFSDKTAAVILETIQGEGGLHECKAEYLKHVRRLCDKHNALLIFDEVQTGIGRTGKLFSFEHYPESIPDAITLAKGLGGGLPIGALLAGKRCSGVLVPGDHASTFGANPVSCAAAMAVLETITADSLLEKVNSTGDYLINSLYKLQKKHKTLKEVRGKGLLVGIQPEFANTKLVEKLIKAGILTVPAGDNVVRFIPPLIAEKEHIDMVIEALDSIFTEEQSK